MMKELELYIHIPFCAKKCPYCDFLSAPPRAGEPERYLRALMEEIVRKAAYFRAHSVTSIFIGGGTPSLLPGGEIQRLLSCVRKYFCVRADAEITIECNPGTLDDGKLKAYKAAGINRLSIGLQAFDDALLKNLGRMHSCRDFLAGYYTARDLGFLNINVDLMYGIPGQTPESLLSTLENVLRLEPEHLSVYSLLLEKGTPFYAIYGEDAIRRERGEDPSLLPSEAEEAQMDRIIREKLADAGYKRYEISNFARAGLVCRHNIGYWTGVPYLGLGLGASSYLVRGRDFVRLRGSTDLNRYCAGDYTCREETVLTKENRIEEYMFLGLRMTDGISRERFAQLFGQTVEQVYGPVLSRMYEQQLMRCTGDRIALTEQGMDISNRVLSEFLLFTEAS